MGNPKRALAEVRDLPARPKPAEDDVQGRLNDCDQRIEALEQLVLAQDDVISQLIKLLDGAGTALSAVRFARLIRPADEASGSEEPSAATSP